MPDLKIVVDWDRYSNFTEDEFRCKCGCGRADMVPDFLDDLQIIRTGVGFPIQVSSGFRCDEYDKSVGGKGAHTTGRAADVLVFGKEAMAIVSTAALTNIKRIGLKQHGTHSKRFIHLDSLYAPGYPSPWIWTYP